VVRLAAAQWRGFLRARLDWEALRRPAPPGDPARLIASGQNLPWLALDLQQADPDQLASWVDHVRTALPQIESIRAVERDGGMEQVVTGFLGRQRFHRSLGCGPFGFDPREDIIVSPTRDSDDYLNARELLQPYERSHLRAVAMIDAEWDGSPGGGSNPGIREPALGRRLMASHNSARSRTAPPNAI
jgi:hypothetical protein